MGPVGCKMSLLRASKNFPRIARQCARIAVAQHQQQRGYADMAFTFASPVSVLYNEAKVKQVDVPSFSGSFGILPDHVPSLAVLKPGVVVVTEEDGSQKKYFASSGTITINDDSSVQVLAEEAVRVDELDIQAIREGLSKAQIDVTAASSEEAKAEAQIALECYEALQKAAE